MERIIISAPFGNYVRFAGATSTLGTFTAARRGGLLWRAWRVLSTLRYQPRTRSWVNRLGLPNPGIASADPNEAARSVVSVHGFCRADWDALVGHCHSLRPLAVELNLSCPNVGRADVAEVLPAVHAAVAGGMRVVAKLPPVRWFDWAEPLMAYGVTHYHLCNTIPTPGGGVSGKPLKQFSLWAVEEFRKRWGSSVTLIGGGGVTCAGDVRDYLSAGADHVAVGSALLNPLNWPQVRRLCEGVA